MDARNAASSLEGDVVVAGSASGEVLWSDVPLSFMGGVDPLTGIVIDTHHPLQGQCLTGRVVALPSGRGSCAGSAAIFEMLLNDTQPAAIVVREKESILAVGIVIAEEFFGRSLPMVRLDHSAYDQLRAAGAATVHHGRVVLDPDSDPDLEAKWPQQSSTTLDVQQSSEAAVKLSARDQSMLAGDAGLAASAAMRVIVRAAQLEGAHDLIDVDMAHIDGCFYQGPASLAFAERLCELDAQVAVPSTMNALRVDRRQWRSQGVSSDIGEPSDLLADCYEQMGVQPTYTCAPYLLATRPTRGQQIAWAESNAVMFANSVLGARTMKYPDYLDILVAITGRAPNADTHLAAARRATIRLDVVEQDEETVDDAFYPALGYLAGQLATNDIPAICGLEHLPVTHDDLKAFGAAFATTSAAPMFHIVGITPEATTYSEAVCAENVEKVPIVTVTPQLLRAAWEELNSSDEQHVDLIALGNPHFSLTEIERLADLTKTRHAASEVSVVVTCGRETLDEARRRGLVEEIERFGGTLVNDTCWCLIGEPLVPVHARSVMTNSAKYAHYGPAAISRGVHFGTLAECVEVAVQGTREPEAPIWARAGETGQR
jgi:predicted aconitase/predicted aconitase with swiveling domain